MLAKIISFETFNNTQYSAAANGPARRAASDLRAIQSEAHCNKQTVVNKIFTNCAQSLWFTRS